MIQGDDGVGEAVSGTESGTTEGLKPGILLQSLRKRYSNQYKLVAKSAEVDRPDTAEDAGEG